MCTCVCLLVSLSQNEETETTKVTQQAKYTVILQQA